mmetsp:Transcript_6390/g.9467  ORF Transcript_6390/g.9467 Transcript_6390/m.9467 type:complete len:123 (+) Transcript_6390:102-470(+)
MKQFHALSLYLCVIIIGTMMAQTNAFVTPTSSTNLIHTTSSPAFTTFTATTPKHTFLSMSNNNNNDDDKKNQNVNVNLIADIDPVTITGIGFGLIAFNFFVLANMGDSGIGGFIARIINTFF